MSNAAWRIRKRVAAEALPFQKGNFRDDELLVRDALNRVLTIIDVELEREAEQQFTRPISQQAEQSKTMMYGGDDK